MLNRNLCIVLAAFVINACTSNTSLRFDPVTMDLPVIDAEHPPAIHELFIPSHGVSLSGFLLTANGAGPHPTVVLLHGYPGNEKNLDLAQSMRRAGFNVLFFHYRGAWGSQGDYALNQLSADTGAVLDFLRQQSDKYRINTQRLSLIGHSMGGFTALRAGANDAEVACIAGIAAANLGEYANRDETARNSFKAYTDQLFMLNNFDGDRALAEITDHKEDFDVRRYGARLKGKSVMLIVGAQDTVVPPTVQESIVKAYEKIPGFKLHSVIIPGDHSFSVNRIQLQRLIVNWLQGSCR